MSIFRIFFSYKLDISNNSGFFLLFRKWNITPSQDKFMYYLEFVKTVANVSYHTLEGFKRFEHDKTLKNIDMVELIAKVSTLPCKI